MADHVDTWRNQPPTDPRGIDGLVPGAHAGYPPYGGSQQSLPDLYDPYGAYSAGGGAGGGGGETGLWTLVTDRMSGRWKYAIPLAILLAATFGVAGYLLPDLTYESQGLVRVSPRITPILRETAETAPIPYYTQFVETQASLVSSTRVVERAIDSLDFSQLPWTSRNEARKAIQSNLSARASRGSELIGVSFSAPDPDTAQLVVNAVLRAYDDLYASADIDDANRRVQSLRTEQSRISNLRTQVRNEINELIRSSNYATQDFGVLLEQAMTSAYEGEMEIRRLKEVLDAEIERNPELAEVEDEAGDDGAGAAQAEFTYDSIADGDLEAFDEELARLGRVRSAARDDMASIRARYAPHTNPYKRAESALGLAEERYAARREIVLPRYLESDAPRLTVTTSVPELRRRINRLQADVDYHHEMTRDLRERQITLEDLRDKEQQYQAQLDQIQARIREIEIEFDSIRNGRITIASLGDRPLGPDRDRRRLMAVAGCMAGIGIGFGFFFLIGSVDRRAFATSQLQNDVAGAHLLGVLPVLPADVSRTPEAAATAAHCVHQIRNHIDTRRFPGRRSPAAMPGAGPYVIAVTSPYQGDGKTSLAMSLGVSYAASGMNTLLLDADIVGSSLTAGLGLTGRVGLREGLHSGDIRTMIYPIATGAGHDSNGVHRSGRLRAVPTGLLHHIGPEHITRNAVIALIEQLRSTAHLADTSGREHTEDDHVRGWQPDVVIIDTGPLLGSIESLPVCSAADGVVLTLRRGRRHARLDECIRLLRDVGANYLGVVLNQARHADWEHYVTQSKVSRRYDADFDSGDPRAGESKSARPADRNGATHASSVHRSRNALMHAMQLTTSDDDDT